MSVNDDQILQAIRGVLDWSEWLSGAVVYQLNTGRYAEYRANEVFYGASLYKLPILYEAFKRFDEGEIALDQLVILEERHIEQDLGTLEGLGLGAGAELTLGEALRNMIVVSDNAGAILLAELLGAETVDETMGNLGLEHTTISGGELLTSAADMARLLTAIFNGNGVSDDSRIAMISLLQQQRVTGGLLPNLPEATPVAHKTGNWMDVTHDVGIVWGPTGPYVIVVLTSGALGLERIDEVSQAVYWVLNPY